jgi:transcriptional regulator with XRE-family HTH domain
MEPDTLRKLRKEMGARQKDLADILRVPFRTYQNWEQVVGKQAYRQIPEEFADKVRVLAELKKGASKGELPTNLTWLQIPLRQDELKYLQRKAELEDKSLSLLIREKIFEILQAPLI